MTGINEKREQERNTTFRRAKDQWGRKWELVLHTKTLTWVAPPILSDATPPFDNDVKYLEPAADEYGDVDISRIVYNVDRQITDLQAAHRAHQLRLAEVARKMYPNDYGDVMKNPPLALTDEVGSAPLPLELFQAMRAGNRWALGIRDANGLMPQRPTWVTDAMLDAMARRKQTSGFIPAVLDDTRFADEETEAVYQTYEEDADPDAVGGKRVPVKRGVGARR